MYVVIFLEQLKRYPLYTHHHTHPSFIGNKLYLDWYLKLDGHILEYLILCVLFVSIASYTLQYKFGCSENIPNEMYFNPTFKTG